MRRGQRGADRFRRIISRALTKQPCWSVVGRLLDTFDKDAGGVSAPQHSARSVIPLRVQRSEARSGTGDLSC
jgi:hypothetical protein